MKTRTVIKPEYQDTWFAVPKVLVEAYMPTIGINALALYILLSCYQDKNGQVSDYIRILHDKAGIRNMKVLHILQYLDRMRLVRDISTNNKRIAQLAYTPQPIIKSK